MELSAHNSTLTRKQQFAEVDRMLEARGIPPVPEHVKRGVLLKADMKVHGVLTPTQLHDVNELILDLEKKKIPYETYVHPITKEIMAIYWCDPSLITDEEALIHINMIVHDTTFGIVAPMSGYEKYSTIATVEPGGRSQVLLNGISKSDRHEYFLVMLKLLMRVYKFRPKLLIVVSDEDRAFIKACSMTLKAFMKFMTLICTWHKAKNVRKPRAGDYADEFEKDVSEEEDGEEGDQGEEQV
jgi:hypothetical protein